MMKITIPDDILKKIKKQNRLLKDAQNIQREVEEWYTDFLSEYPDMYDISDDDFADISYDDGTRLLSFVNIRYNFDLIENFDDGGVSDE